MKNSVSLLLRIGLAFSLIYAGVSIFINPDSWVGFIPDFISIFTTKIGFLYTHAVIVILLGLWLLSNKWIFYSAILTAISLLGIVVFNLSQLNIVFRDISILFMAIALAVLSRNNK